MEDTMVSHQMREHRGVIREAAAPAHQPEVVGHAGVAPSAVVDDLSVHHVR